MNEPIKVDVYPVGLRDDLRRLWRAISNRRDNTARYRLKRMCRSAFRSRSYWNGYLAEPTACPPGLRWTRCGHGWTKRRAVADLYRHLLEANR